MMESQRIDAGTVDHVLLLQHRVVICWTGSSDKDNHKHTKNWPLNVPVFLKMNVMKVQCMKRKQIGKYIFSIAL